MNLYRNVMLHCVIALIGYGAMGQQETGTIAVFRITTDHAFVAADSLASRTCRPPLKPIIRKNTCKILAFDNKFLFVGVGYDARFDPCQSDTPVWSVQQVAKDVFKKAGVSDTHDFASKWKRAMEEVFKQDAPAGTPLYGLFIGAESHKITGYYVIFRPPGVIDAFEEVPANGEHQYKGVGDVIREFDLEKTKRAKEWHQRIDKLSPDDQITALVKLAEEYDTSGTIGGDIDSVRLTTGGVKWLTVKKECSEN
jgi:hypothetical protein